MTTILESLAAAVRKAAGFNSAAQAAPSCILWPDGDRLFENAVPLLLGALPELLVLGEYDAEKRTGPAIWIRCALGGTVEGYDPGKATPIVYLPGVSRSDLRIVEALRPEVRPLAYYAFRGAIFQQKNGKDWTPLAFLVSKDGGLGLNVAADTNTKNALQVALAEILGKSVSELSAGQLDAGDFNGVILGGDTDRMVLQWLNGGDAWFKQLSASERKAFSATCVNAYSINPERDGQQEGLRRFARRQGAWKNVFGRYEESYTAYPQILPALQLVSPPPFNLFDTALECGGWPQWNDGEEKLLLGVIQQAGKQSPQAGLKTLKESEERHGERRKLIWAKLGLAPLANAIKDLSDLAQWSLDSIPTFATIGDLAAWYEQKGWHVDQAAWLAVAKAGKASANSLAVKGVVRNYYKPWLEKVNNAFQAFLCAGKYPSVKPPAGAEDGTWCIFADGLRLDTARELRAMLESKGFAVEETPRWAPLPTITACGKPGAVPGATIPAGITGNAGDSYDPLKAVGTTFSKFLETSGFTESKEPAAGKPVWWAMGDLDTAGHEYGENLPLHIPQALDSIAQSVEDAFSAGARKVRIVTDHGWLWLPGAFAKVEVPKGLTMSKSARFAAMKPGVSPAGVELEWSWNPGEPIAFAPGVCCHVNGYSYVHGGLSLQECRLLDLAVEPTGNGGSGVVAVDGLAWRGARFSCVLQGDFAGCTLDIRKAPHDSQSLLFDGARTPSKEGGVKGIVEDESLIGKSAYLVVSDSDGNIKSQSKIILGGIEE